MTFDIIEITESEIKALSTPQRRLLASAQQKKNELLHKLEAELAELKRQTYTNRVDESSIYSDMESEIIAECAYQVDSIRKKLIFDMEDNKSSLGSGSGGSGVDAPYRVDYSLSYVDRYIIVRDYYLSIPDPYERLELYRKDTVAYDYLGSYYGALSNYLASLTKT